ncbi:hypothetical protein R1sor_001160 [Riccia sorocarpa]|uniref:Uncharacterized protein n=1 Tax=Riccia sorocarpa TaxID=122646 RepID=A0ABD3GW28_9MARC
MLGDTLDHSINVSPVRIGNWANVADAELVPADARGIKRRLDVDRDYTPDRGNVAKRRSQRNTTDTPAQESSSASENSNLLSLVGESGQLLLPEEVTDPLQGSNIPGGLENTVGLDFRNSYPASENWALGPTMFVDSIPGNVGALLPSHHVGKAFGIVGLHAPNKRRIRIETWRWLDSLIQSGNWVVCDDFNQVDRLRDSVGPSPRLHGSEERIWNQIVHRRDLWTATLTLRLEAAHALLVRLAAEEDLIELDLTGSTARTVVDGSITLIK